MLMGDAGAQAGGPDIHEPAGAKVLGDRAVVLAVQF